MTDARYRWTIVAVLSVTETVSYGILTYAFPVFIPEMERELGWSRATITGALSAALLVAGLAAIPVGRWVDRHGPRLLMTAGSVAAALLVAAWAGVQTVAGFYAIWVALGFAMAAVLYEPALAAVATWFTRAERTRALTTLTFVAGFASIVFVPLAAALVARAGWRDALLILAAVLAAATALPHALLLRRAPAHHHEDAATALPPGAAVRGRQFRAIAASFALAIFANNAVFVHLLPSLTDRGYGAQFAAFITGAIGIMALPGRLVFTPLGTVWPREHVTALLFLLQAAGLFVLAVSHSATAIWIFVLLFGAAFGAITPARAALVVEVYGPVHYGAISGALALVLAFARAAAPAGASALQATAGYDLVFGVLGALCLAAGALILPLNRNATTSV